MPSVEALCKNATLSLDGTGNLTVDVTDVDDGSSLALEVLDGDNNPYRIFDHMLTNRWRMFSGLWETATLNFKSACPSMRKRGRRSTGP